MKSVSEAETDFPAKIKTKKAMTIKENIPRFLS